MNNAFQEPHERLGAGTKPLSQFRLWHRQHEISFTDMVIRQSVVEPELVMKRSLKEGPVSNLEVVKMDEAIYSVL